MTLVVYLFAALIALGAAQAGAPCAQDRPVGGTVKSYDILLPSGG